MGNRPVGQLVCLLILVQLAINAVPGSVNAGESSPVWSWRLIEEGLHVYRFDMDGLDWRQIRRERDQRRTVQETPKRIELLRGLLDDPFAAMGDRVESPIPAGKMIVRDPDGVRKTAPVGPDTRDITLPEDIGLNGRYLVGGHFVLADGDGRDRRLHLYPKMIVGHYKNDGRPGSHPAFFIDDPDIALEIGSARSPAQYRMGGGFQRPHERSEMEVRYQGRPLAGATVEVIAEGSAWRRSYRTDGSGRFTVTPFDDRSGPRHYEKLLYVVRVEDPQNHALHVATLPMIVFRNRPEWTSHVAGYGLWAGLSIGGTMLLVGGAMLRKRRQQRLNLVRFDQCRIKEE